MNRLVVPSPTGPVTSDYGDRIRFDFGVGYINPATLPARRLAEITASVVRDLGDELARYPARRGWEPLRVKIGERRAERNEPRPDPDSIVLTNGALGAIRLAIDVLAANGDAVIVEEWTYNVAMTVFRHRGLKIEPVAMDEAGLNPGAMAEACGRLQGRGQRVVLYTIPTFHNPTGITMPVERRLAIVDVARERDIAILEDDCYGELRLDGDHLPSLWSIAPERTALVGSMSKIIAPSLRLGYVVPPERTVSEFLARKLDGGTDLVASALAAAFLDAERGTHLAALLDGLRQKREAFLAFLAGHCPRASAERVPDGGFYILVRFPPGVSSSHLLELANDRGVAFFSTPMCRADRADGTFGRFAFAWPSLCEMDVGLSRLASLIPLCETARIGTD